MSYAPTKGEITDATFNDQDQLSEMTTNEKKVEFVDSYTYDENDFPEESEASKELKQKFPFGSGGVQLGLRISL